MSVGLSTKPAKRESNSIFTLNQRALCEYALARRFKVVGIQQRINQAQFGFVIRILFKLCFKI